jgi:hypothetical protein
MVKEFQVGKRYSWGNSPLAHLCISAGSKRDGKHFGVFESDKGGIFINFDPNRANIVVPPRTGKGFACYEISTKRFMGLYLEDHHFHKGYYEVFPIEWKEIKEPHAKT